MSQRDATGTRRRRRDTSEDLWYAKRIRFDQNRQQVVPILDELQAGSTTTSSSNSGSSSPTADILSGGDSAWLADNLQYATPKPGTPVNRKVLKRVGGKYLLGPKIGNGPVECIVQYLARRENTDQFFHLKMLILDTDPTNKKTVEGERQAKLLLHSEYQLLKMLENEEGVIRTHDLFMDSAYEEEPSQENSSEYVYTGRVKRRIVLAVDCLAPHDFDDRSGAYINLQQYVIHEKNLSEMRTLLVFYEIIKIVESLHKKNIVHRDLKLRNIILNTTTNRVVITNFCLGKQLLNENDYLHDQRGSPAYISPDVLSASHQNPYKGKPSDIWALGVVLYTMLYSQFPFFETIPAKLFKRIKSVDYKIPKHTKVSENTQFLIKNMLLLNPDDRLTASEIREQIERVISNKRQFFLRVDQMVPEIDLMGRSVATPATAGDSAREATKRIQLTTVAAPFIQEPTFDLSQERLSDMHSAAPGPLIRQRDGIFLLPKRDRSRMSVHQVENDARLLTGHEWGQYSRIIRDYGVRGSSGSPSVVSPSPSAAAGTGSNSTMSSRMAVHYNTLRSRHMWRYNPVASAGRSHRGNGEASPSGSQRTNRTPPPRRTADPTIARLAVGSGAPSVDEPQRGLYLQQQRTNGRSVFIPRYGLPTSPSPSLSTSSANASLLTFRLRPQSAENLNQMVARIDRILSSRMDEAARDFCSTLSTMFSRGRIPNRVPPEEQAEFNGVVTTELAEQIGDWLLQDCSDTEIVRDVFGDSTVNAKEKLVELLRRCGVQIEIGPTIEIKRAQNFDSILLLSYILQASGYSSSYFA